MDSPSGSGLKSIVSGPLEEFLTSEKFWELYEKQARAGFTMSFMGGLTGAGVKSHEVTDLDDGGFQVQDVVKGGIFHGDLSFLTRHTFDKEKKEWTTKVFDQSFDDSQLKETITIKEISSPFRIEAWTEVVERREAGAAVADILASILAQVVKRAGVTSGDPVCKEGVTSSDGKSCAVSEALDASIAPDQFWALYVGYIKEGLGKGGIKEHTVKELDGGNFEIIDTFESLVTYENFVFDAEKDLLISYTHENDETLSEASCLDSYTSKVLREPLRVEFYKDARPGRKTPHQLHGIIQGAIDSCIKGAEQSGSWFG